MLSGFSIMDQALLPLTHSWPVYERDQHLDLGFSFDWEQAGCTAAPADSLALARNGIGLWECDLRDNALTWSTGVFDLFGFPRGQKVERDASVALYAEPSRAAMERLRSYSIKHRRGFTIDVEIAPANGGKRWIRLTAVPVCFRSRVVRLQGIKRDVTFQYR